MSFKSFVAGGVIGAAAGAAVVISAASSLIEGKINSKVSVGDMINWESNGSLVFPEPREVTKIENDEDYGTYVFVKGEKTGIPYEECIKT